MSWYITAKIDSKTISTKIKQVIRESSFFTDLFARYSVPMDKLDNLTFKIKKLHGKYATSNSKEVWLNEKLFENNNFFNEKIHYVVHEIVHWLVRQREKQNYFADPEEVESFIHSIRWQILHGKDKEQIREEFFPIMNAHFDTERDTIILFDKLFAKALELNGT